MMDALELARINPVAGSVGSAAFMFTAYALLNGWKPLPFSEVLGVVLAVLCVVLAIGSIWGVVEKEGRNQRLSKAIDVDAVKSMSWQHFEQLVADAYRQRGYRVSEIGGQSDGGIDLVLQAADGRKYAVQCKNWKKWKVGRPLIQQFLGVLVDGKFDGGVYVISGTYSQEAVGFASKHSIQLVDGNQLVDLINTPAS